MTIWIIEDKCDGCQRCIKACPYDGIEMLNGIASVTERCTSCGACIEACKKNHAIESKKLRSNLIDNPLKSGRSFF